MGRSKLVYRVHAVRRMLERQISEAEVRRVIETGEVIVRYRDDRPYPSRLILGWSAGRPLHVLAADHAADRETVVVTVYEPDPALWDRAFRRRRRS
jgi:Domain of unknown function (DUF4258)